MGNKKKGAGGRAVSAGRRSGAPARPQPPGGRPGGLARTIWGRELLLVLGSMILIALAIGVGVYVGRGGDAASAAGPAVGEDLHSLVVDPTDPARVLVGGHQSAAESRDGGAHWDRIGGLDGADPMGWLVDPRDPRRMVVGGHPGLRRTADGGASWTDATGSLPASDVHALGMDPGHPDVLYAYLAGRGIYRSGDRGAHWGLVSATQTPIGPILVDPRSSSTLYVADTQGTFRRSTDGGRTWLGLGTIPGGMATWLAQDQQRPGTLYAATGGIRRSTDGGHTWLALAGAPAGATAVAVAPSDGRTLYAAGLQGTSAWVSRSRDGGARWQAMAGSASANGNGNGGGGMPGMPGM